MVVKVAGSSIVSKAIQPSKKLCGKVFCVTGRLIDLSDVQFWNAFVPSLYTDGGSTTVSSLFIFLQIYAGTSSTFGPKVKEVTLESVL